MSKKASQKTVSKKTRSKIIPGYVFVKEAAGIEEYELKSNGLRVLYYSRPDTNVVTTNITYLVGAIDEKIGETGIAHMLEHMLFKPTTFDKKAKVSEGGSMHFERNVGCVLNANTWKDRTTYYFSYPKEYIDWALRLEAERMTGVILTQKEFTPEQGNVLSEFDMYNGDPHFALAVQMVSSAFHSHPYGHETLGYREDIEDINPEKLECFYRRYYQPNNAVMMVVGDVDRNKALSSIKKQFGTIKRGVDSVVRNISREPVQEGLRRVEVVRPSSVQIVSLGFKHEGFGSKGWVCTRVLLELLTNGPESVLHKLLVDSGKASSVDINLEPTRETNLAMISITLSPGQKHKNMEVFVLDAIRSLKKDQVDNLLQKVKIRLRTEELFERDSSMQICQELTECVASGDWTLYEKTQEMLDDVSESDVISCTKELFQEKNMTIGYFIGK